MPDWVEREVLITVKAYPVPSSTYRETSCTAAISKEEGWIRLHPIAFRQLPRERQFRKYQLVRLRMTRHSRDSRRESYRPEEASLTPGRVLGTRHDWAERKAWILPTASESMCEIQAEQKNTGRSLGVFRPAEVRDLSIEGTDEEWTGRQKGVTSQLWFDDLKGTIRLKKVPLVVKYSYRCEAGGCRGHKQMVVDWELGRLYWRLRDGGESPETIEQKIRQKYLDELCGPGKDTHFYVGNHSAHRASFMVLGVFWPPKTPPSLFPATLAC